MDVAIYLLGVSILILVFAILLIIGNYSKTSAASLSKARKSSEEERRTYARYKTSLRVKYKTPLEEGISWIRDISEGGARLFLNRTLKTLEIGESLGIEISLPHETQPISIEGNIVWSKEDDAGINFDKVVEGDINRIIKYVKNIEQI